MKMRRGSRTVFRLCQCGCGTMVEPYISPSSGRVEGYPKFVPGHGTKDWGKRQKGKSKPEKHLPLGTRRTHRSTDNLVYWVIKIDERKRWPYEHRVIAEQMIGRKLASYEHVHHKNNDTLDNRPENLEIMLDAEHVKLHNSINGKWSRLHDSCIICGSTERRHIACGECSACYQRTRYIPRV